MKALYSLLLIGTIAGAVHAQTIKPGMKPEEVIAQIPSNIKWTVDSAGRFSHHIETIFAPEWPRFGFPGPAMFYFDEHGQTLESWTWTLQKASFSDYEELTKRFSKQFDDEGKIQLPKKSGHSGDFENVWIVDKTVVYVTFDRIKREVTVTERKKAGFLDEG